MKNESKKKSGTKKYGTRIPVTYNLRHGYVSKSSPKHSGNHPTASAISLIVAEPWYIEHNDMVRKQYSKRANDRQMAKRYFDRKNYLPDDTKQEVSGHNGEKYSLFRVVHTDREGWATAHPLPKCKQKPRKVVVYVNTVTMATEPHETFEQAARRIFS